MKKEDNSEIAIGKIPLKVCSDDLFWCFVIHVKKITWQLVDKPTCVISNDIIGVITELDEIFKTMSN